MLWLPLAFQVILLSAWAFQLLLHVIWLVLAWRRYYAPPSSAKSQRRRPPISVIQLLRGVDVSTRECISATLSLTTQKLDELLFSVETDDDPCLQLLDDASNDGNGVCSLSERIEAVVGGPAKGGEQYLNAKLRNCHHAIASAHNDHVLLIDSNALLPFHYLTLLEHELVAPRTQPLGLACGYITGLRSSERPPLAELFEHVFLVDFFGKGALLSRAVSLPVGIGKCMLLNRAVLNDPRIGGVQAFAQHFAEDAFMARAIHKNGFDTVLLPFGAPQSLRGASIRSAWSRFVRWGIMRKTVAPAVFWTEPLLYPLWITAACAVLCTSIVPTYVLFGSAMVWLAAEYYAVVHLVDEDSRYPFETAPLVTRLALLAALLLEHLLLLPLWFAIAVCRSIEWHKQVFFIDSRGLIKRVETSVQQHKQKQ